MPKPSVNSDRLGYDELDDFGPVTVDTQEVKPNIPDQQIV